MSEFFFSPKRAEFLKSQVENFTPQQRHRTLLDVCRTRWTARIDGLDRFEEIYEVITLTLQSIRSLCNACSEFTFIVSLLVAKYFIYLLLPLTSGLQERELDKLQAYGNIHLVKYGLKTSRSLDTIHDGLYDRAVYLADFVGVKP